MKVIAAAIKHRDIIYTGSRHAEIIRYMTQDLKVAERVVSEQQGFLLENGKFVSRDIARVHACRAGQIDVDHTRTLMSEDLW